jgi:hypothetical protein
LQEITEWLGKNALYHDLDYEHIKVVAYNKFRELRVEPPTPDRIDRIIRSAISSYETKFFQETYQQLSKISMEQMDILISNLSDYDESEIDVFCRIVF